MDEQASQRATLPTPLTRMLGCTSPIQQAGFGSSLNIDLVSAVCGAGGIGMLGGALAAVDDLRGGLQAVRARASGPVGVNFVVPFLDLDRHRDALEAAAADADLVEFFYGEPDPDLISIVHAGGALAGWQVGSVQEASLAQANGVDVIVVQGMEAGGHVRGTCALLPMLAEVLGTVSAPVIAAGGICSPRAMAAALAAGAAGVRMGTRFVASVEADFHRAYKAALVQARAGDTVYGQHFDRLWPDAPHRVLASAVHAAAAIGSEVVGRMSVGREVAEVPRFAGFAPVADATGAVEAMALFAGEGVGEIDEVLPAAEIVRGFTAAAAGLLASAAAR